MMNIKQDKIAGERTRKKIEFNYDPEPDFSWLEQDYFKGEKPQDHIALCMCVYEMGENDEDWQLVDSLCGIDFLQAKNDWQTGTFYHVSDLPKGYLRQLAREAGLPE